MKKIAFVVQRYGLEINGGAELHCMQLARKLSTIYDVEVLTTCALDYMDWSDHYPPGVSTINNVTVRRFKVSRLRDWEEMAQWEKKLDVGNRPQLKSKWKRLYRRFLLNFRNKTSGYLRWIEAQGPTTPDLISYLKSHEQDYETLIFFTYLYYPTVFGIDINPSKTMLIPTAHDEWAIRMPVYKKVFCTPSSIMYNTIAEKTLVNRIYNNESVHSEIAGVGVDVPEGLKWVDIKKQMKIDADYILYVGRIDINKITPEDFQWFLNYIEETKKDIKLVLVGKLYMEIPLSKHIMHLGFVDDEIKFNLIRQSLFLFQPSRFESLSMVVLEAFMMARPVLVHKDCEVMKDHIDSSNGGFYFNDYAGFKLAFNRLTEDISLNNKLGMSGKAYVELNYKWENIVAKFQDVIENRINK